VQDVGLELQLAQHPRHLLGLLAAGVVPVLALAPLRLPAGTSAISAASTMVTAAGRRGGYLRVPGRLISNALLVLEKG